MMPVVKRPRSEPPVSWQPERVPSERDTRPDIPVTAVSGYPPPQSALGIAWQRVLDRALASVGLQRRRA